MNTLAVTGNDRILAADVPVFKGAHGAVCG
jgi:hypothetical protein